MQNDLWEDLPKTCGLLRAAIWKMRAYLKEHRGRLLPATTEGMCQRAQLQREENKAAPEERNTEE
jgi:hypothetical protein